MKMVVFRCYLKFIVGEFRLTFVVILNTLLFAFKRWEKVRVFVLNLLKVCWRFSAALSWWELLSWELLETIVALLRQALILCNRVALTSAKVWISLLSAGWLGLTIEVASLELRSLVVCLWVNSLRLAVDRSHIFRTVHLL
jgi:hypothetical protein